MQAYHNLLGLFRSRSADGALIVAIFSFIIGTTVRIMFGHNLPLWIDETFTGAIAGQTSLKSLLHQVSADVNAPLYYVVMYVWTSAAGLSDSALRWPSVLFATVAVILAYRGASSFSRTTCLIWGSLLSLWLPGLFQASEARCYALLLLTSTATTIAFAQLLALPTRRMVFWWALFSSLSILTHYFAAILVVAQGIILVFLYANQLKHIYPAFAVFVPVGIWIGYHLPRLLAFGDPSVAWYQVLGPIHLLTIVGYILNSLSSVSLLIVSALMIRSCKDPFTNIVGREVSLSALASLLSFAAIVILGMIKPSFSLRYCVPFVPGILLGFAIIIQWASKSWAQFPAFAILLFGAPILFDFDPPEVRQAYSFEAASAAMQRAGVKRLVFLWDHPSSLIQDPDQMQAVGGFFLRRSGTPVEVVNVANSWRDDPQPRLLKAAGSEQGTAILWLYDSRLAKTAALAHSPQIEKLDPSWRCSNYSDSPFVSLVCLR